MSGIINKVGSKSGIIGTTELFYESGTFSPGLQQGSNNAQVYAARNGNYTRVGDIVFVTFELVISDFGSMSGTCRLYNMPFTCTSQTIYYIGAGLVMVFTEADMQQAVRMQMNPSETTVDIVRDNFKTGTHVGLHTDYIDTGTLFRGSFQYRAA